MSTTVHHHPTGHPPVPDCGRVLPPVREAAGTFVVPIVVSTDDWSRVTCSTCLLGATQVVRAADGIMRRLARWRTV